MTYYIQPEETGLNRPVIMRSGVQSRRKNIGKETEYVNEDMHNTQRLQEDLVTNED